MKTNNFLREDFEDIRSKFTLVEGALLPFFIIAIYLGIASMKNAEFTGIFKAITLTVVIGFIVTIVTDFIFCYFGIRRYRTYATQIIDYDDKSIRVEKIKLTPELLKIFYSENDDDEVNEIAISLDDYDIAVKVRRTCEVPIFIKKKGVVNRLILPYEADEEKQVWNDYKIYSIKCV